VTPVTYIDGQLNQFQDIGLKHVFHRFENRTSVSIVNNNNIEQPVVLSENSIRNQQFPIDDKLKHFFQNEMHGHHVASNESDESIAR
jgi:hypothetical protein